MSAGYFDPDRVMSVELYKGDWILRAALPGDKPVSECAAAEAAMSDWKRRNREHAARHRGDRGG